MKHYMNMLAAVLLAALSLSLAGCGGDKDDEPGGSNQSKNSIVEGTIKVKYERDGDEETKYAALGFLDTDNDVAVTAGFDGSLRFYTNLYDEDDIKNVAGEEPALAGVLLGNSSHLLFQFGIYDGKMRAGEKITIKGIVWESMGSGIGGSIGTSVQEAGTVTVKAITTDKVTIKFDNVSFGTKRSGAVVINGEISYPQPGKEYMHVHGNSW